MRQGLLGLALLCGCTDGATRIAHDIESGVAAFRNSAATSYSIKHVPEAHPAGCSGPYSVQLGADSVLVIWCKDATGSRIVASHGTTHHLRFVDVPHPLKAEKPAGDPLYIELEKQGERMVVVNLR